MTADVELATAAAYRIGGKAGLAPAVPGAPDNGRPDLRAWAIGWAAKFGTGGNIGGGTFEESRVASVIGQVEMFKLEGLKERTYFVLVPLSVILDYVAIKRRD